MKKISICLLVAIPCIVNAKSYLLRLNFIKNSQYNIKENWKVKNWNGEKNTFSFIVQNIITHVSSAKATAKIKWKLKNFMHNNKIIPRKIGGTLTMDRRGRMLIVNGKRNIKRQRYPILPKNKITQNSKWKTYITIPIRNMYYQIPVKTFFKTTTNNRLLIFHLSGQKKNLNFNGTIMKIKLTGKTGFDVIKKAYKNMFLKVKYYMKAGKTWRLISTAYVTRKVIY